jgi:sorting nexin-29
VFLHTVYCFICDTRSVCWATMNNTQCRVKIQIFSEPINVKNGVRQGDALACLLFNIALEKVIRDVSVNIRGTIFF